MFQDLTFDHREMRIHYGVFKYMKADDGWAVGLGALKIPSNSFDNNSTGKGFLLPSPGSLVSRLRRPPTSKLRLRSHISLLKIRKCLHSCVIIKSEWNSEYQGRSRNLIRETSL